LSRRLNYAVVPAIVPVEDILCGVEKAVGALPEETAEEVQETVRILRGSRKSNNKLTGTERRGLQALKANEALKVHPADKGNATVVLDTADYNRKIAVLLEDQAYTKLKMDPTESVERKTLLLLPFWGSLPTSSAAGFQPSRLYGLPKIRKQGAPLRPTVSTVVPPLTALPTPGWPTGLPYWQLSTPHKELDRLCPHIGFSLRRSQGYKGQLRCGVTFHQGAE
jgi:hypothetical protein